LARCYQEVQAILSAKLSSSRRGVPRTLFVLSAIPTQYYLHLRLSIVKSPVGLAGRRTSCLTNFSPLFGNASNTPLFLGAPPAEIKDAACSSTRETRPNAGEKRRAPSPTAAEDRARDLFRRSLKHWRSRYSTEQRGEWQTASGSVAKT